MKATEHSSKLGYLLGHLGVGFLEDAEEHVGHGTPDLPAPELVRQPALLVAGQHVPRRHGLGGGAGAAQGVRGGRGGLSLGTRGSPSPGGVAGGGVGVGARGHAVGGVLHPPPALQTPTSPATFTVDRRGQCDVIVVTRVGAAPLFLPWVLERQKYPVTSVQ